MTFLTFFKNDRVFDLMIINFENTASRKYRAKKSKSWLDHNWLHIHFLFLSKNDMG